MHQKRQRIESTYTALSVLYINFGSAPCGTLNLKLNRLGTSQSWNFRSKRTSINLGANKGQTVKGKIKLGSVESGPEQGFQLQDKDLKLRLGPNLSLLAPG